MLNNKRISNQSGQSLVETMIMLPFLAFLMIWMFQMFRAIHSTILAQNIARQAIFFKMQNDRNLGQFDDEDGFDGSIIATIDPPIEGTVGTSGALGGKFTIPVRLGLCAGGRTNYDVIGAEYNPITGCR